MTSKNLMALILTIACGISLHQAGCTLIDRRPRPASFSKVPIDPGQEPFQKTYPVDLEIPIIVKINGRQSLIIPKADYRIAGRVVSKRHYYMDWYAKVAPVDLALAWGPMATHQYDKYVSYSHSDRFYHYEYTHDSPVDKNFIGTHSANEHLIPANSYIAKVLKSIKLDEIIELEGYLVNVVGQDGDDGEVLLQSSLTRTDTGDGGCELVYVKKVRIGDHVY